MIRREPWRLMHAAFCVAATLLLLVGQEVVGLVLWGLAWLYVAYRVVAVGRRLGLGRRVGSWVTVRLVLAVGVGGLLLRHSVELEWAAWVGLGLSIFAIRAESVVARAGRYRGMRMANVPGFNPNQPPNFLLSALTVVEFIVVPAFVVFALMGVPGWVWILAMAPAGVLAMLIGLRAYRQRNRTRDAEEWVPELMAKLAPEFVLYWDAPKGTAYQVGMWIPYLKRIRRPFFVMVRNPSTFNQAVAVSEDVPVILCRTMADMDRCMTDTLTTAFYVNNGAKNAHFVRYPQLTHVQLLHGDSDKASSFNPITVMFDKVYVAGQAGIDRYINHGVDIPPHKFEIVGRPQVEDIRVTKGRLAEIANPRILYAPTWRGNYSDAAYSSLPQAPALFEQLLARGCSIVFRPHPYCRKDPEFRGIIARLHARLAEHTNQTGVQHTYGRMAETEMSVVDCFNASDAMISDVSSVIVDFLHSEKPFALIAVDRTAESFTGEFPLAAASYVLSGDAGTWVPLLDQMFGSDPLVSARRDLRVHYLGDFDRANYADGFISAAATQVAQRTKFADARPAGSEVLLDPEPGEEPLSAESADSASTDDEA